MSLAPVQVMGVLNVTDDSFSDGGRYLDPDKAVAHGLALAADGADIVDVGENPPVPVPRASTPVSRPPGSSPSSKSFPRKALR